MYGFYNSNNIRSFLFGYLENLWLSHQSEDASAKEKASAELQRIRTKIEGSMAELVALGYSEFTFETFYDVSDITADTLHLFIFICSYILSEVLVPVFDKYLRGAYDPVKITFTLYIHILTGINAYM